MKNKGFTIIEVLAVAVVLAVIVVIMTPKILKTVKSADIAAFKATNQTLVQVFTDKCSTEDIDETSKTREYVITNGVITPKVSVKGKIPDTGKIYVSKTCEISLATNNSKYCAMKLEGDPNIYVGKYVKDKCIVDGVTTYDLTLNAQGGTVSESVIKIYHNGKYGEIETPIRSGYTFLGWYTEAVNGTEVTSELAVKNDDHTIYAHWTPIYNYNYTGSYQTFTAPLTGTYLFETWGAQGGDGGKGAYASGKISLTAGTTFYVFVGQMPTTSAGGYNGGGSTGTSAATYGYKGGGGATDIRITNANAAYDQKRRLIVAAGGGGGNGGAGGALTGENGIPNNSLLCLGGSGYASFSSGCIFRITTGGTQTNGGVGGLTSVNSYPYTYGNWVQGEPGSFYQGSNNATCSSNQCKWSSGGGGGWYGGGGGANTTSYSMGGGGGSSFVSGYEGCQAVNGDMQPIGKISITGISFEEPVIISGSQTMPDKSGSGTTTGNTGNGYAKITYIK